MKDLIIVESPAKAKKIQKWFKDGNLVRSTCGHIRDLDPKSLSVDVNENFSPIYSPIRGKTKVISDLVSLSQGRRVILAADDDREGDAIAWHTGVSLNLNFSQNNRIVFHEISENAIKKSLQNIHTIDMNSVNAQQARRVIDRLVGYTLSPLLWKHIESDRKGLSAGRVQSCLLAILKDKDETIRAHVPEKSQECSGQFVNGDTTLMCLYKDTQEKQEQPYDPLSLLENLRDNREFIVDSVEFSEDKQYPPKPLITSTLQRSAYQRLRFPIKKTMSIAQKLYENGKITYMRTDSPTISSEFQAILCNHIKDTYGPEHYQPSFSKKVKGAQEAHECIRVTSLNDTLHERYDKDDISLYKLIKEFTICSHLKPAILNVLTLKLVNDVATFEGINRVYDYLGYLQYSDNYVIEPQLHLTKGETFHLNTCRYTDKYTGYPSHYDEPSIVRTLESSGIGRPSTYASIVATLANRDYTERTTVSYEPLEVLTISLNNKRITKKLAKQRFPKQSNRIVLTELGEKVLEYLKTHFGNILSVEFTSQVERDLDRVSEGSLDWTQVVKGVYESFIGVANVQSAKPSQKSQKSQRSLGIYEGHEVILKIGQYGPYLSYNERNINLKYLLKRTKQSYADITLTDVKDTIRYPLLVGNVRVKGSQQPIMIHIGPYGKYMKFMGTNIRIPQKDTYTFKECIEIIRKQG